MDYVPRQITGHLASLAAGFPVVTLTGPRQTGKTTLARHCFPELAYANLEDPDVRAFAHGDPRAFLGQYAGGAILDEVQRAPHLLSYLQGIVDADPRPGRWVLTGSHNLQLLERVTQSLAGRTGLATLLPFSLAEAATDGPLPDLDTTLRTGGYPRAHVGPADPLQVLKDYYQTFVERDLRALLKVHDLSRFDTFVRLCAGRVGQVLNLSSLAGDAGISPTTAADWLGLLEAAYVVVRLPPFHANLGKRLIKSPKLYFVDVGLAAYLLGVERPEHLPSHPLRGHLFENLVILEAWKHRLNQGLEPRLHFYRDHRGHEVDLLYPQGPAVAPVEIKAGMTISSSWFDGLRRFAALVPGAGPATVVHGGDSRQARSAALALGWRAWPERLIELDAVGGTPGVPQHPEEWTEAPPHGM